MSTIVMSACWPLQTKTPAQKAVLMSLADNANDEGVCWPSVARMVERTCLSERAVQDAIKWLIKHGAISASGRTGRSTMYTVTPATFAPPQEMHPTPAASAPPPPQHLHPTPAASAPRTVIEPKEEPTRNRQGGAGAPGVSETQSKAKPNPGTAEQGTGKLPAALGVRELVAEGVERQHAQDWLKVRKEKRQPLTATAWELVKGEAAKAGIPAGEAVRISAENSWAGFRASWMDKAKDGHGGAEGADGDDLGWLRTWSGIVAQGERLKLRQAEGEAAPAFKLRVVAASGLTDEQKARARADFGLCL